MNKAEEVGLDWWKYDRHLSPGREQIARENEALRAQVRSLERRLANVAGPRVAEALGHDSRKARRRR